VDIEQPRLVRVSRDRDQRIPFVSYHARFEQRQRRVLIAWGVFASLLVVGYLASVTSRLTRLHGVATEYFAVTAMVIGASGAILLHLFRPRLRCIRCKNNLEKRWTKFCSECGSGEITPSKFLGWRIWPQCNSCGEKCAKGKYGFRYYKIRFCTHCGAFLTTEGV